MRIFFYFVTFALIACAETQPTVPKSALPLGDYDCRVLSETILASIHLENSGPPQASSTNEPGNYFGIQIDQNDFGVTRISETETSQRPINQQDLEFGIMPSVLMEPYLYDGTDFRAPERVDFMQFYGSGTQFYFWQSGYQYPGGEDTQLVTRYGECAPRG